MTKSTEAATEKAVRRNMWLVPSIFVVLTGIISTVTYGTVDWLRDSTALVATELRVHESLPGHAVLIERNAQQQVEIQRQLYELKEDLDKVSADVKTLLLRNGE